MFLREEKKDRGPRSRYYKEVTSWPTHIAFATISRHTSVISHLHLVANDFEPKAAIVDIIIRLNRILVYLPYPTLYDPCGLF